MVTLRFLLVRVDESNNLFVFELIESKLFLFFLKNELFSFQLSFELLSLPFETPYFLLTFFLCLSSLAFQLLDLFLELIDCVFVDLLLLGWAFLLLFFEFGFDLLHFGFLNDVGFMKFSDLLLFLVDSLDLFLGFLGKLF